MSGSTCVGSGSSSSSSSGGGGGSSGGIGGIGSIGSIGGASRKAKEKNKRGQEKVGGQLQLTAMFAPASGNQQLPNPTQRSNATESETNSTESDIEIGIEN